MGATIHRYIGGNFVILLVGVFRGNALHGRSIPTAILAIARFAPYAEFQFRSGEARRRLVEAPFDGYDNTVRIRERCDRTSGHL